nr:hypothetical protein BaRGS_004577 [Batillaria attramentaria]
MQLVLDNIRELAERRQEVMMVISQLEFRKYLDNQVDPITAAATRLPIPRPDSLGPSYEHGDFDLLMINRRYGLIIGEVKSVGADPQYSTDQAVARRVQKAVKQLNKSEVVLRHLVSDLAPVNVTKILMLPNATCAQLQQALDTNPHVEQVTVKNNNNSNKTSLRFEDSDKS